MSQKIGQQHFNRQNSSVQGGGYATVINNTSAIQIQSKDTGSSGISYSFLDSGLRLTNGGPTSFSTSNNYYLHAIIKRQINSIQTFNIKLIKTDSTGEIDTEIPEQWIKRIEVVDNMADSTYVDVEIIFNPRSEDYNTICFQLNRSQDYDAVNPRKSKIAFIELSIINNQMPSELSSNNIPMSKIGVQSHPDLMMCINGEEIHMPRSGIFELRDGIIKVAFFSVVNAATLNDATDLNSWLMTGTESVTFSTSTYQKTRQIDGYTLDYMYDSNT